MKKGNEGKWRKWKKGRIEEWREEEKWVGGKSKGRDGCSL